MPGRSPSPDRSPGPRQQRQQQQQQPQQRSPSPYGSVQSPAKLGPTALKKSVERLFFTKEPPKELGRMTEPKVIPKAQMDESVSRLYKDAVKKRKDNEEAQLRKYGTPEPSKRLSPDELGEAVQRQYAQAMKQKETGREVLASKLRADGGNYAPPLRKELQKEAINEANARLFSKPMERKAELREELASKFIQGSLPSFPKKTQVEWEATVERLYSKK
eukprot:TRINITY_DN2443_c0_g1_i1.p1 TRINITY_DN2443_c0_g1~~TRINITY_DN2443_c0_g1_i1.p1  ORF type:complete len:248 (+),score=99.65 TRINITY_DN2443_c0_g1_i1:93-746(+)